ncbi:hypothetical protein JN00_0115 [Metamycoplasma subdolum]|uniref:Uncharacterized protein n=1 Tax=Metamycoplasma subdolum TaxID=92407 RepID=A0A3M0A8A6_9BACT|nr:hypothetical protein [Metamycoplasma subdolum]RMA79068.1 hypothetical protein JN00_0115 [Metamycoplasma subdolum]WPB50591.1 hypothetical protein R9C05_00295 [Metamycoplasma subdolum]
MSKKLKLLSTLFAPIMIGAPLIALSCKNGDGKIDRGTQTEIIKSNISKNKVLTELTNAYLLTFYENEIKTLDEASKKGDVILNVVKGKKGELYKDLKDMFTYFSQSELDKNPQYFSNLKAEFIKANVDASSYNVNPFSSPTEEEMIFLFEHSNILEDNVRLTLQKNLAVKLYLLKSREEIKKLANNDKKEDKQKLEQLNKRLENKDQKDDRDTTLLQALDLTSDSLYLEEHLLNNHYHVTWSFTDSRDMNLRKGHGKVKNVDEFNLLASYNPTSKPQYDYNPVAKHKNLLLASGANEGNLDTMRAYKGFATAAHTTGDLYHGIYFLKSITSPIFGYLDAKTKKVFSQDAFKFAEILEKAKTAPKVKIKTASADKIKNKTQVLFTANDIQIDDSTSAKNELDKTIFTLNNKITIGASNYTLQLEAESFEYDFAKSFDVTINWKLTVKELEKRQFYTFKSLCKDLQEDSKTNNYNLLSYPKYVNFEADDSSKFDATYLIKIAPLYKEEMKSVQKDGKTVKEKVGFFTFENTPWSSKEEKEKIIQNLLLVEKDNLFKNAAKYFKNLGFKIDETKIEKNIVDMLKSEGIL